MKSKQRGFTLTELVIAILWLVGTVGWILNIVWIVKDVSHPLTTMFILRCVGIFVAPLGAVLGFM